MDDVVGIKVRDARRGWFGFITWGRLWEPIDDTELLEAVKPHLRSFSGITDVQELHICHSLQDLRSGEYFYEALIHFSWSRPPFGDGYNRWKEQKRRDIQDGRELYFVGALQEDGPARSAKHS